MHGWVLANVIILFLLLLIHFGLFEVLTQIEGTFRHVDQLPRRAGHMEDVEVSTFFGNAKNAPEHHQIVTVLDQSVSVATLKMQK